MANTKEYNKQYYIDNKEQCLDYQKEYYKSHPRKHTTLSREQLDKLCERQKKRNHYKFLLEENIKGRYYKELELFTDTDLKHINENNEL